MSKGNGYPSDLSDAEWNVIRHVFSKRTKRGRPQTVGRRELLNAMFYVVRSGCQWRMLPKDFPKWQTVASQFYRWRNSGLWERIHHRLHQRVREQAGKSKRPTAGIIDSQSVKTTEQGGPRGYDGGKKINGRKRHIVVDTLGMLIAVLIQPASRQDYDGAEPLLGQVKKRFPRLKVIYGDSAYGKTHLPIWAFVAYRFVINVVKRISGTVRFHVLPKRWIVERTFGWLGRSRRLSKDYEVTLESSKAMIYIAMIKLMLRRLAPR